MDVVSPAVPTESEYKVCCHIAAAFAKATGRLTEHQALLVILEGRERGVAPVESLLSYSKALLDRLAGIAAGSPVRPDVPVTALTTPVTLAATSAAQTTEAEAGAIDQNAAPAKPDESWKRDDGKREADTVFLPFDKYKDVPLSDPRISLGTCLVFLDRAYESVETVKRWHREIAAVNPILPEKLDRLDDPDRLRALLRWFEEAGQERRQKLFKDSYLAIQHKLEDLTTQTPTKPNEPNGAPKPTEKAAP